jgi:phosphoserine aminotransferase
MYRVWWQEDKGGGMRVSCHSEAMNYSDAQALCDRMNANDPACGAYVAPA